MGYFPNGCAGSVYESKYCFHCVNRVDLKDGRGFGCPIWDLHIMYSYELCNSKSKAKKMLDFLIPIDKKAELPINLQCSMFQKMNEFENIKQLSKMQLYNWVKLNPEKAEELGLIKMFSEG